MPRATKSKPDPAAIYVSWQTFATRDRVVAQGTRLRGSDPVVRAHPGWFLPDGTPVDELQAAAAADMEIQLAEVQQPPPPQPPEPLRDEDALVAVRDAGGQIARNPGPNPRLSARGFVHAGERVPKDHPAVRRDRAAFIDVVNGVPRDEAVVAKTTFRHLQENGQTRIVYAGTWLRRDDPLAVAHPHQVRRPEPLHD